MRLSFARILKPSALRRFGAALLAACAFGAASSSFAQSSSSALPDYSRHSPTQLEALIAQGDRHAVFTKAYNMVFDANGDLRQDAAINSALSLFHQAHNAGHETANSFLTIYYYGELGHEPDIQKADQIAIEASEKGFGIAQLNYGLRYVESEDSEKSRRAFTYLKRATTKTDVSEHAYAGLLDVLYGVYSERQENLPEARGWAKKCIAAIPDSSHCQYMLARDFEEGWGGAVNLAESTKLFTSSANLGDPRAQWKMGMFYLNGDHFAKNERTAFNWVKKSADQEFLSGLISFAVMNAVGQGTAVNKTAAFNAYEAAAKQGSGHAIRSVGAMYCAGEAPVTDRNLCGAALILAYELEDDLAGDLLGQFFQIQDQAGFDALKQRTAAARETLLEEERKCPILKRAKLRVGMSFLTSFALLPCLALSSSMWPTSPILALSPITTAA